MADELTFRARLGRAMAYLSLIMSGGSVAIFLFLAEFRSLTDGFSAGRAPLMTTSVALGVAALLIALAAVFASRGRITSLALAVACVHLLLHGVMT